MLRIAVWNAQWSPPDRARGRAIRGALTDIEPDVIVLTEGSRGLFPDGGHVVTGGTDWGYSVDDPERRKVLLWSLAEWVEVDDVGNESLPPGRWIAATTATRCGPVRLAGVCIPWRDAHVSSGRRDREPWDEHRDHLDAMRGLLAGESATPFVLAGDFNQRIPRVRQPIGIATELERSLDRLHVVTQGEIGGNRLIDHVAVRGLLPTSPPRIIDRMIDGVEVTDHFGVVVELTSFE